MPVLADDEVIVDRNAERPSHRDDRFRHLNVGGRRRRITRWVIVHEDYCGRGKLERAFDHFARIDRGVIDRAGLLYFIGDKQIALVEEQRPKLLAIGEALRVRQ